MKVNDAVINAAREASFGPRILSVRDNDVCVYNTQDVIDTVKRRYGRNMGRIPTIEGIKDGVRIHACVIRALGMEMDFPPECSRIHLCTPDLTGRSI